MEALQAGPSQGHHFWPSPDGSTQCVGELGLLILLGLEIHAATAHIPKTFHENARHVSGFFGSWARNSQ